MTVFTCYCGHKIMCEPDVVRRRTCCPYGIYQDVEWANSRIVCLTDARVASLIFEEGPTYTRIRAAVIRANSIVLMIQNLLEAKVKMDYAALHPELCCMTEIQS